MLYTDGLIEDRDESPDESVGRLVGEVGRLPAGPDFARRLFESLVPSGIHEDDIALLVLTRTH